MVKNYCLIPFQNTLKKLLLSSFLFCLTTNVFANETDKAISVSLKAILETKTAKKIKKNTIKAIHKKIPIKGTLATVIDICGQSVIYGKLNTKKLKYLETDVLGGKLRFDAEYNWRRRNGSSGLILTFPF